MTQTNEKRANHILWDKDKTNQDILGEFSRKFIFYQINGYTMKQNKYLANSNIFFTLSSVLPETGTHT